MRPVAVLLAVVFLSACFDFDAAYLAYCDGGRCHDGGPADPGDGGTGFCGGAAHTRCLDFDDGRLTSPGWGPSPSTGAVLVQQTWTSAPNSVSLTTRSGGVSFLASVPPTPSFRCSLQVRPVTLAPTSNLVSVLFEARSADGARSLELRFGPRYLQAVAVDRSSTPANYQTIDLLPTGLPLGEWARVELAVSESSGGTLTASVNGIPTTQMLSRGVPPNGYEVFTFGLLLNIDAPNDWSVGLDDLTCDTP